MKVTLRHIAEIAGVSQSTASRALSSGVDGDIGADTVARIRQVAQELGYVPRSARKTQQRQYRIGRILWDYTDPFCVELARGMDIEAPDKPACPVLTLSSADLRRPWGWEQLRQANLDGLIAVELATAQQAIQIKEAAGGVPLVRIDIECTSDLDDQVCIDTIKAMGQAVGHLAAYGYSRIAFIGGTHPDTPENELRTVGFRSAMQRLGLELRPEYVVTGGWSAEDGYQGMSRLLSLPEPPQAVATAGDRIAIGAIRAASEQGLRVPQDIAIIGFDDIEVAAYSRPALSTVSVPKVELGDMAVRLLIQRIEGRLPSFPIRVVLPTRMVVRESCGAHQV